MSWCDPIGYVCGCEIFCPDCAPDRESPVFDGSETDRFSHCPECETLIPESLTRYGLSYVLGWLDDARNGIGGRLDILDSWAEAISSYGMGRAENLRLERYLRWRQRTGSVA